MSHPSVTIKILYSDPSPLLRVVSLRILRRIMAHPRPYRSLAALYRYTRSPLNHDTKFCIATLSLARLCARALPHAPRAGRPYRRPLSRPYRMPPGRVVAESPAPRPASPTLCHDTIHCIMTQMGSSPSGLCTFFFFLILDYLPKISQPPKVLISPMLFIKHTST